MLSDTKANPRVAIIIINWRNVADTLRCLRSVYASDYPNYIVIVVDNGSKDSSTSTIRQNYPNLILLENEDNAGYTGGNNLGIKYALEQGIDYIFLLNDDAIVASDTLSTLVRAAQSDSKTGFWGPIILSLEAPNQIISAGGVLRPIWSPHYQGVGATNQSQFDTIQEVDYLSGCALLISRAVIERIGALDDRFFAYCEDIEWCYRAKAKGFRAVLVPQARVWHPDTRTRDDQSVVVAYYSTRNWLLFAQKHQLGLIVKSRYIANILRTILSWSLKPRWRAKREQRNALIRALKDFVLGRFGRAEGLV